VAHFAVPMAGGVLVTLNTRLSPAEIAHIIETVRRYLRAGSVDTLLAAVVRASVLDSFKPYLHDRLADGERNATRVARRDRRAGLHGGYKTLARYLRPLRCVDAGGAVAAPRAAGSAPGRRLDHRPSESA
jgi:acyl-CoA synthetase (AMP-forming)/AMP-acid ligase II